MTSTFATFGTAALALVAAFVAASILLTSGHHCLGALVL